MKTFKLTLKKADNIVCDDFRLMSHDIIQLLKKHYGLLDEPDTCNTTIKEYLLNYCDSIKDAERALKDLCVKVFGNDFPKSVEHMSEFLLVGDQYDKGSDDFCPVCGSPDYTYYCEDQMYCSHCESITHIDLSDYRADDSDLFTSLSEILKP
jgi:hypothetical protein